MILAVFRCPRELEREIYSKAYELAREAIIKGKNPAEDEFVKNNFCSVVV